MFWEEYSGRHPAAVPTVCNLSEKSQEIPLLSVQKTPCPAESIFKPRWPFSISSTLTDSTPVTMPTGKEEQEPQEGEMVCVCFAYFQPWVRKALTESPVVCRGNELGFFNDYLRVICFLLLLALDAVIAWMDPYGCGGQRRKPPAARRPCLCQVELSKNSIWHPCICYSPFIKDRHVDNNQFCSAAAAAASWLSCLYMVVIMKHVCQAWLSSSWWSDG